MVSRYNYNRDDEKDYGNELGVKRLVLMFIFSKFFYYFFIVGVKIIFIFEYCRFLFGIWKFIRYCK